MQTPMIRHDPYAHYLLDTAQLARVQRVAAALRTADALTATARDAATWLSGARLDVDPRTHRPALRCQTEADYRFLSDVNVAAIRLAEHCR